MIDKPANLKARFAICLNHPGPSHDNLLANHSDTDCNADGGTLQPDGGSCTYKAVDIPFDIIFKDGFE